MSGIRKSWYQIVYDLSCSDGILCSNAVALPFAAALSHWTNLCERPRQYPYFKYPQVAESDGNHCHTDITPVHCSEEY